MNLTRIDKSNLRQVIMNAPKQFVRGLEAAKHVKIEKPSNKIVICGMGGSALAGALLKMVWAESRLPEIVIWRNYGLPSGLDKQSLVIAVSYSGNTEETLSAYRSARNAGLPMVSLASGGKLEELSKKNGTPFAKIPNDRMPPRSALGYMFAMLVRIFANGGLIPDESRILEETAKRLEPAKLETQGRDLARKIKNRIPLIYVSEKWGELAHNWKIKFNENAKIPAFFNFFPELHHNEMNSFEAVRSQNRYLKNFYVVIIEDESENLRLVEGIRIFTDFLKKMKVPVTIVPLKGKNAFEKIFNNLTLADWVSYYTAISRGIDPSPTKIIEEFKKRMAS